ncbi:hypothetical protein CPB84DRAFT_1736288 [Gymnopilus junonius]|uniref:Uncharacterized protein n=1 Tax=Gymnopilus junonius TaxID=109634 RepID=A0A9P5NDA4_GYMJU|nr:hypothetical protein CPB84DRAFT_1736288 [Gymnopilus junonius]
MKPSQTTSVKGSFPLPQSTPVRTVMAAFNANLPTSFMTSPTTHSHAQVTASGGTETRPSTPLAPTTPSRRRLREPEIDPDLYTPTKRMRILYSGLASTSSGSFLVSKVKLTSSMPIIDPILESMPPLQAPDWTLAYQSPNSQKTRQQLQEENGVLRTNLQMAHIHVHAQDGIIEGAHATMVVQNIHLRKLNGALYAKETDKSSDRTFTIDTSKATVYTKDDIRNGIYEKQQRKAAAAAEKKSRQDARVAKKGARAKLEEEWKAIKVRHEKAVELWKLDCEKRASEGVLKKDMPKKPKLQRKPKLPPSLEETVDDEEVDDEEDDENELD